MDMATITTAYEGLKIGKGLLKGLLDIKVEAEAKERVDEVLAKLGDAQDTLFTMREELFRLQAENQELHGKIKETEKWEAKLAEYVLAKTTGGAVVYEYKAEPHHFACPSCIENKSIQILQDNRTVSGKYRCVSCGAEFPIKPRTSVRPI